MANPGSSARTPTWLLRLRSCLELWSHSWHGWFLEQSFLVGNLLYNDTFVDVLFRDWNGDSKSSRCLPNTSTFVPNDRSQCLYCLFPIMQCAFGAHLDVGLAERRTPCRFVGNLTFPSLFLGEDGRLWKDGIVVSAWNFARVSFSSIHSANTVGERSDFLTLALHLFSVDGRSRPFQSTRFRYSCIRN